MNRCVHMMFCLASVPVTLSATVLYGAEAPPSSTSLTIYSTAEPGAVPPELYQPGLLEAMMGQNWVYQIPGYATVKQERQVELRERANAIRFTDVAAQIDATTVTFSSITDPQTTRVLDQNFEFDLVSAQKLMQRFLDHEITIHQVRGDRVASFTGTLLSTNGGVTLKMPEGGVQVIANYSTAQFPDLPGGLITKPTLVWNVATEKPGMHKARVTYETRGITWWADYNVVYREGKDANSGVLDIGAWASILNQSGASYEKATLKLVAGDVQRAPQLQNYAYPMARSAGMSVFGEEMKRGFVEKSFFEYHLYTLGRPVDVPDRSTKQIELFPMVRDVACEKLLVYEGQAVRLPINHPYALTDPAMGQESDSKVDVQLRFKNDKDRGLGIPLPSGRMRVSKLDDADGSLEFIGENTIDHTAKNEQVMIKIGSAFDVVGSRKQADFGIDTVRNWMDETIELSVRNRKTGPVKVIIKERLYRWTNWEIREKSHDFEKADARTIHFPVTVEPDQEVVVKYKVHYSW